MREMRETRQRREKEKKGKKEKRKKEKKEVYRSQIAPVNAFVLCGRGGRGGIPTS